MFIPSVKNHIFNMYIIYVFDYINITVKTPLYLKDYSVQ
jgi:hypothetical protein